MGTVIARAMEMSADAATGVEVVLDATVEAEVDEDAASRPGEAPPRRSMVEDRNRSAEENLFAKRNPSEEETHIPQHSRRTARKSSQLR